MKTFYVINDHRKARFLFWMYWMVYFTSYLGRLNYSSTVTVMIQEAVITKSEAGFVSMSLFWCINGYAQSMIWPPIIRIFSEMLEEKKKVQYCIDIVSTQALGTLAPYLLSAAIIGWGQWEFVFLAAGVPLFTAAVVWTVSFKRIESYSRRFGIEREEERKKSTANVSGTASSGEDHSLGNSFVRLIVTSGMVMIVFPAVVHGMLKDGVTSWVPTYISETFRISASFSIIVTALLPTVNLSGAYMARYVYEKLGKQETKAAVVFYVAATAALILLLAAGNRNLILTAVLFAVITASMMAVNTLFVNLYPLKFKALGRVSAVSGFLNAMAYLGTAFSTFSIGILVQKEGWSVTLVWGIYYVEGLMFPLQLVITKKLPNKEQYEERIKMCEALRGLFEDELKEREEVGLERGMERGTQLKLISQVRRKMQKGLSAEEIAEVLEEPVEVIRALLRTVETNPQCSDKKIYESISTEAAETSVHEEAR